MGAREGGLRSLGTGGIHPASVRAIFAVYAANLQSCAYRMARRYQSVFAIAMAATFLESELITWGWELSTAPEDCCAGLGLAVLVL